MGQLTKETYRPEASDQLARVYEFLQAHESVERGRTGPRYFLSSAKPGDRVEIPSAVHRVLRQVVEAMCEGLAVTIAPQTQTLTTQPAAADLILDVDADRQTLASAAFRGDGLAIVEILSGRSPRWLLQHAGTALLVALAQHAEGAADLVPPLVDALRERDDDGDDVLAEQLTATTTGQPTGRRAVPADLDMLSDVLEGDLTYGFGGYLDLTTGQAWPEAVFENEPDDEAIDLEDDERWLNVPNLGSREAWWDMRAFVDTLTDISLAQKLADAIEGRGAFSRFRRVMDQHPDHVPGWLAFRDERRAGRARSWLADNGYDALPPLNP
jgi:hypothetical protein